MLSKKYYTDLEKDKIYVIEELKEPVMALEHDVTKIHKILKELPELYDAMTPEEIKESDSFTDCVYSGRKSKQLHVKQNFGK